MPSLRPLLPALLAAALAAPAHAAGSEAREHPAYSAARDRPGQLASAPTRGLFVTPELRGQPSFPAPAGLPGPAGLFGPSGFPGPFAPVPGFALAGGSEGRTYAGPEGRTYGGPVGAPTGLPAPAAPAGPAFPAFPTVPAHPAAADPVDGIETARVGRQVAPGVRLESYDRLEGDRWLRIDELVADLGAGSGVRAEYLGGVGPATVAEAAARHAAGPGRRVVAAVNGDFFDIRATGAPLGPGVRAGRLLHSASPGPGGGAAVGFGADGTGRVLRLVAAGTVILPGGPARPLAGYNAARPPEEGFSAYTADWSGRTLPAPAPGPGAMVELRDATVAAPARTPLPSARPRRPAPGTTLLFASGARQTAALVALRAGDRVTVTARPLPTSGPVPVAAVGGREPLVVDGRPLDHTGRPNDTAAPRTAAALSEDGRRLRLVTVDGRQRDSGGLTLTGLGRLLHRLGAHQALNLDGGGSSTLLASAPGASTPSTENSPSDGSPRPVPNGLVLTAPTGSGQLAGYRVEAHGAATRLFPGLTRTLTATGHDTSFGPAAGTPQWTAGSGRIGPDAVFRAGKPGPVTVEARRGSARGTLRLDVLGPLDRIRPAPARIGLLTRDESATLTLTGYDAQGAAAPVEPRDVTLHYDRGRWSVTEDGHGGYTVTALVPRATGRLRATIRASDPDPAGGSAGGVTAEVALGVGSVPQPLAGLDDAAAWTGTGAAPAEGRSGRGLALEPGPDRPAGATPPRPLPVPELARSVSLWVHGDASGARPALELLDADGAVVTLRGPAVHWAGWRELNLPLPGTAERPLTLTRLSATGTRSGRLVLDTLTAPTPPTGPAVPGTVRPDPVVASADEVRARSWRFAVAPAPAPGTVVPAGTADLVLTGAEPRPFVHRGVRFLPLDTTRRTLDGGGLARVRALTGALDAAAREPWTGALAVVAPYAPHTVDGKEAALLTRRLAEFRRDTGKNAVLITPGAPRFSAARGEGVPTVATTRTTRTLFGVDAFPPPGHEWLSVRQERP
ncbi:phosphodiester glycosidase family protein [Streptomyces sp. NPDC059985]|uniref:phosphodiester glycosidase family protein n=1 Tax=Streptomyces sp. NPDC059985 TaxID=3347025 RepID=UPI0036AC1FE0